MRYLRLVNSVIKLVILLGILTSICLADDTPLPTLIISDSGYSWMIQGEDGTPILYKFSQVVVIGKPPQGVPVPPTTAPEFGIAPLVPGWLVKVVDKSDLPAIKAALQQTISGTTGTSPKLKTLGEVEAVTGALIANSIKNKAAWSDFGIGLNTSLISLQQTKKIVTPADYGRALAEVLKALP